MPIVTEELNNLTSESKLMEECPWLSKAFERVLPHKFVIEAPDKFLPEIEELLIKAHHARYTDAAPVISVDVAELLPDFGDNIDKFSRDVIYTHAFDLLNQLSGGQQVIDSEWPLDSFDKLCSIYEENNIPVLLIIKNFDAVLSKLEGDEKTSKFDKIHYLILTTMRTSGNFKRCLHVDNISDLNCYSRGALNDAVFYEQ